MALCLTVLAAQAWHPELGSWDLCKSRRTKWLHKAVLCPCPALGDMDPSLMSTHTINMTFFRINSHWNMSFDLPIPVVCLSAHPLLLCTSAQGYRLALRVRFAFPVQLLVASEVQTVGFLFSTLLPDRTDISPYNTVHLFLFLVPLFPWRKISLSLRSSFWCRFLKIS